jgi:tetratricopeptide (TPR) repeat protein
MLIQTWFRQVAFAITCALFTIFNVRLILRPFQASHLASRANLIDLERAVQLEPSNAEYHDRLGQLLIYRGEDPEAAVSQYQVAVRLNHYVARYWLDLANAYLVTGRTSEQRDSLENAVLADPTTPDVAWQAANFFLLQGDREKALHNFRVVLANDPSRVDQTLQLCWRTTANVKELLDEAIPERPEVYFSLLHLLIQRQDTAAVKTVWNRLTSLKQSFPIQLAFPYFHFLLSEREVGAAERAWRELASLNRSLTNYLPSPRNLAVNGGFEEKILDGGFDWLYFPSPHVRVASDTSQFYSGTRSLSITFEGQNPSDAGIAQFIPVKPNTKYAFTAAYRTEEIMSASGPRFSIADAYTNTSYVLTEDFLGTSSWRLQQAEFQTGPNTDLVLLKLARQPAEPLIQGKMWIDDIQLVETQ